MAKCIMCGRSGLTLKVDAAGLCPDCQTMAKETNERQLARMQDEIDSLRSALSNLREEYACIPSARDEAERILAAAHDEAESILKKANGEAALITSSAMAKLEQVKKETSVAVAAADAQISALLALASNDFIQHGKSTIGKAYLTDKKTRPDLYPDVMLTPIVPSMFKRISTNGYVVFDLETTGLSSQSDSIIEIGAIKYNGARYEIDRFSTLVNPNRRIPPSATAVNHITDSMVESAPPIQTVLPDFLTFIGDRPLVAHNASFDAAFLEEAFRNCGIKASLQYADSLAMAKKAYDLPNYKLGTIAEHLHISQPTAHRSLGDCDALGQIVRAMLNA